MLRLCWRYLRPSRIEGQPLGPCWARLGPSWAYLGPMLGPCWPMLALCWPYMLAYVSMLALSWPCLGPMLAPCWPILGPMLRLCWRYVRPSLLKDFQDANCSFLDPSAEPKTTKNHGFLTFNSKKWDPPRLRNTVKTDVYCDLTH